MTAGLPVGIAAWLRILVSFFIIVSFLASSGEASAASSRYGTYSLFSLVSSGSGKRPGITITSPVSGSRYSTSNATLVLGGRVSSSQHATRVTWQNDRGGQGVASGTETWSTPAIQLVSGTNRIVVKVYDQSGRSREDRLTVSYKPPATPVVTTPPATSTPPPPVTIPAADTTAPTAPSGLSATASSTSQINLSWNAASDGVGVTGYRIERCQGVGCANFTQIATSSGTSHSNTGLNGSTSYSYRVRATDAAGNLGSYSAKATAVTATANRTPVISGSPATSVVAGTAYAFTPVASDPDGQPLTFSIMGAPAWANFSQATGTLSGTPGAGQVGLTEGVVITVSDGTAYASLPAFSVAVIQAATGSATISWLPPTERTDGSALTNLAGYYIRYGTSVNALNQTIKLNGAGLTTYVVEGLTPGQWYFGVSAFDTGNVESTTSNIGTKRIL